MTILKEIESILENHNLTPEDIHWIGNKEVKTNWENFKNITDVEPDFRDKIACDILIVGDGWWLERYYHTGTEWWGFRQYPKEPIKKVYLKWIVGGLEHTDLKSMNAY